jgi:metal-responsive CopG/Arc/MetJ family transcriptional regulator
MKAVQVLFDEALLERLDADAEVRAKGRSAVLRRAAAEYLRGRRARGTAEAYRRAYGASRNGIGDEYAGWPGEGAWPGK